MVSVIATWSAVIATWCHVGSPHVCGPWVARGLALTARGNHPQSSKKPNRNPSNRRAGHPALKLSHLKPLHQAPAHVWWGSLPHFIIYFINFKAKRGRNVVISDRRGQPWSHPWCHVGSPHVSSPCNSSPVSSMVGIINQKPNRNP